MKIAVVGTGISGLSSAWLLSRKHDVVLFEAAARVGGHSNTIDVETPEGPRAVDTGFIVYNAASYPNLVSLFDILRVPTVDTDMSFAFSLDHGAYEYCGTGLNGLFGQRSNIFRSSHWRLIGDILRFFREASSAPLDETVSLGEWLEERRYSKAFIDRHIIPMGAAIWSTPAAEILDFPFAAFAQFFRNHGLLKAFARPLWRTIDGGSREYVRRMLAGYSGRVSVGDPVRSVAGHGVRATVTTERSGAQDFDAVVLACHADEALRLLSNADEQTSSLLGAFRYARNVAVVHSDPALMPARRRVWSSWNYMTEGAFASRADNEGSTGLGDTTRLSLSYWMNKLQPLRTSRDIFVTLNPLKATDPAAHIAEFIYHHPMYDARAMAAQKDLWRLQGNGRVWLAGSYWGSGFHEDGAQSGLWAAEDLSETLIGRDHAVRRPWTVDNPSGRIVARPASSSPYREAAE